jgi:DNA helicase HerA-like ATPase
MIRLSLNQYRKNKMLNSNTIHLENSNRQLRILDVITVLMTQSTKLIDIVNANQKEVNRLKEELEQLKTHSDNATDSLKDGKQLLFESDDVEGELLKAEQ